MQAEPEKQTTLCVRSGLLQEHLQGPSVRLGWQHVPQRVRAPQGQVQEIPQPGGPVPGQVQE